MSRLAFVFPGQGAQVLGMGQDLAQYVPIARQTLEEADEALGISLSSLMRDGPDHELELTANAQPAILATSVAAWRALREQTGATPVAAAGHSLGEYSALVCAGSLELGDALHAVRLRGELMQKAVPVGSGAMAAVIGLDAARVAELVAGISTSESPVAVSGYNSPMQTTISGEAGAVQRATVALDAAGARSVKPLRVSAPFHCPLMAPVEAPLGKVLESISIAPLAFPVVANVDAQPNRDPGRVRDLLIAQLTGPVRWVESVAVLRQLGASRFVEFGPGRTLSGLIRRIDRELEVLSVADQATLAKTCGALA